MPHLIHLICCVLAPVYTAFILSESLSPVNRETLFFRGIMYQCLPTFLCINGQERTKKHRCHWFNSMWKMFSWLFALLVEWICKLFTFWDFFKSKSNTSLVVLHLCCFIHYPTFAEQGPEVIHIKFTSRWFL